MDGNSCGICEFQTVEGNYYNAPPLPEPNANRSKSFYVGPKAIVTTEKLIASQQPAEKSLMQQLLTGKKRFAGQ